MTQSDPVTRDSQNWQPEHNPDSLRLLIPEWRAYPAPRTGWWTCAKEPMR